MILEGVDHYRVMDPLFEGIRVVMSYRGAAYSPAYIQGISGAAFRIGGTCPCAPTCSLARQPVDLIHLLGYRAEHLALYDEGIDLESEVYRVLDRVKEEIRAGRPALLWHAFTTAEWDVVAGFDEADNHLYGRGSYMGLDEYAAADETRTIRCLHICPALGAMLVGDKTGAYDALGAEIAALKEAVRHARSRANKESLDGGDWAMLDGLLCYDRWVSEFRNETAKLPSMGDRYCLGVYRSTHRAAASFLHELAQEHAAAEQLEGGAAQFAREADALNACAELLVPAWQLPIAPDPAINRQAAMLLAQARDHYAAGITSIETSLQAMGA